jgi:hypothetical protein
MYEKEYAEFIERQKREPIDLDELTQCIRTQVTNPILQYFVAWAINLIFKPNRFFRLIRDAIEKNTTSIVIKCLKSEYLLRVIEDVITECGFDWNPDRYSESLASAIKKRIEIDLNSPYILKDILKFYILKQIIEYGKILRE